MGVNWTIRSTRISGRNSPAGRHSAYCTPSGTSADQRLSDFHLTQLLGFPAETALAATRLIFGVVVRHRLVLCLAHGGGCVPSIVGRLDLGWAKKAAARTTPRPPSDCLGEFYYDSAVFDTATLRFPRGRGRHRSCPARHRLPLRRRRRHTARHCGPAQSRGSRTLGDPRRQRPPPPDEPPGVNSMMITTEK